MEQISSYILEKLSISKGNHISDLSNEDNIDVLNMFDNDESLATLEFILNFIKRSKPGPYKDSIFNYWDMCIDKNTLNCMHSGWSRDGVGFKKTRYVDTVVSRYNTDNHTNIKPSFSSWTPDAGIPILKIKEVVDALEAKFTDVDITVKNLVKIGV